MSEYPNFFVCERGCDADHVMLETYTEIEMNTINILDLEVNGQTLREYRNSRKVFRGEDSTYHRYVFDDGLVIDLESTAKSVMEELVALPFEGQIALMREMYESLPFPGDQVIVGGDRKERGARAVRLTPTDDSGAVSILLTH